MKTKFGSIALAVAVLGIPGMGSVPAMAEGEVKPGRVEAPAAENDFLPPSYQLQRYAGTQANSAFDREIFPGEAKPDGTNPLEVYRVVGIGKIRGKYLVTIVDKKNAFKTIRSTADGDGFAVESVTNGRDPRSARVVISDGTHTAEIGFDEKRLLAAPKGNAARKVQGNVSGRPAVTSRAVDVLANHLKEASGEMKAPPASRGGTPPPIRRRVVLPHESKPEPQKKKTPPVKADLSMSPHSSKSSAA